MRVLCLNPPFKTEYGRFSRTSRSPAITKSSTIYYPIWLCYVAGVLEEAGHEVQVIDSCAYGYDLAKTVDMLNELSPGMAVLDTSTPSIYEDIKTGAAIKQAFPACFVVLMGTHPSALPEETLQISDAIDAVAVGEADYTVRELAEKISDAELKRLSSDFAYRNDILGDIAGLTYRAGDRIVANQKRAFIADLDALPFASKVYKKHLDTNKYFFAASDFPEVQIMTARGCVARCTFCVYPQTIHGWKYRYRSAESVADEFEWIEDNMPEVREIGIEDDTFTGSRRRTIEFCRELIRRGVKIKWYCNVRVDLKYNTMQWMKKAGCVLVTVGYESADEQVLKNINKRVTPDMILEFSKNTRRAGLLVHGCFMAGNRGDTRQTLAKSLDFSLKLMDDTMQFFPLMVYPGTIDYEWAKREGLLTVLSHADYVTKDGNHNSVLRTPEMSSEEISGWCDYARRRYYLRPKYVLYKLAQQIRRPTEIRRTVKAARRFARFLIVA